MSTLISDPLDIMKNKEAHQLYEQKGLLPESNQLDVLPNHMELCHKHWPDNFEALYDIGAKAFETFLIDRDHLTKLFNVEQVKSDSWKQHFVLDRCVLHMLQMFHETISSYHNGTVDEEFYRKLHVFGGRYRSLAPLVAVEEYFHLFNLWAEKHIDFISLTCYEGPVCNNDKKIIESVWKKIIQSIKIHFVYGWHHKKYTMTREEMEYFHKDKTVAEPTRSRLITKLARLMSRESFSDASIEEKASPTRKLSHGSLQTSAPGPSRITVPTRSTQLRINTSHSREEDIDESAPIEICDISLDFVNKPDEYSPINVSRHF